MEIKRRLPDPQGLAPGAPISMAAAPRSDVCLDLELHGGCSQIHQGLGPGTPSPPWLCLLDPPKGWTWSSISMALVASSQTRARPPACRDTTSVCLNPLCRSACFCYSSSYGTLSIWSPVLPIDPIPSLMRRGFLSHIGCWKMCLGVETRSHGQPT